MAQLASSITPCIWFDDQAEQAARFYTQTFPQGRITATSRYPESSDNPGGKPRGSVLTVEFEAGGQKFTALNGGPHFVPNPSVSFFVFVDGPAEADQLFGVLAEGGTTLMALDRYPWSKRYGWAQDRFGVSWQVSASERRREGAMIVPSLLFTGPQSGKAEAAMRAYASIFPGGAVDVLERYAAGEGPEGGVKFGLFRLGGQEMAAMDSPIDHGFGFNEALSL
jgi:predicted 3-demethylubiquinone-9 3-methyltransferase (glyoxalase superfamily)